MDLLERNAMSKREPLFVPEPEAAEIVKHEPAPLATIPADNDPMSLIRHMIDRGQMTGESAAALSALVDLKNKQEDREARKSFTAALVKFRSNAPVIAKSRKVDFAAKSGGRVQYNFAALEDIEDRIAEWLNECGFAYTFPEAVCAGSGMMRVTCKLTHIAGHSESTTTEIPVPTDTRTNPTQQGGMAISYGKRYTLCMALGLRIVGEDNDARSHTSPDVHDRAMQTVTFEESVRLDELADIVTDGRKRLLSWASKAAGRSIEKIGDIPSGLYEQAVGLLQRNKA